MLTIRVTARHQLLRVTLVVITYHYLIDLRRFYTEKLRNHEVINDIEVPNGEEEGEDLGEHAREATHI